jgi:Holliday junction resolvase RusA-like endonuclease
LNANTSSFSVHATSSQGPVDLIEQLAFVVPGVPVPQGSKKAFVIGRRAVIVDDNADKLKPWRAKVRDAAETALAGRPGFPDAVYVLLDFHMPRPPSVKRLRPSVRPDIDKLTRSILDSLTDSGVLKDDGQVVSVHSKKFYADDEPHVAIKIGLLA